MDFNRPILKIVPASIDTLLDRLSLAGVVFIWIYIVVQYSALPPIIPIHFDLSGVANNYGSKVTVFLLPGIITIIFTGLTVLNKYPHIFNYTVKITAENARREYTNAVRLIRIIKLVIVIFIIIISFDMIRSAKAGHSQLPSWIIPIFMFSMILPVIISIYLSSKNKGSKK